MSLIDKTIAGHYRISEIIGKGGFGETYRGIDTNSLNEVAIKVEPNKIQGQRLPQEYKLYRLLSGGCGIPSVEYFGSSHTQNFLVMDLLGKSLEDIFKWCQYKFSLKTVLMLADQMISCIQWTHMKGLIHRDIKPDNFMIGVNENSNKVYLIDYGLMKSYYDFKSSTHIRYLENTSIVGTARYSSIGALSGNEQSRRDDLIALGYVLAYFLRGSLPWMSVETTNQSSKYRQIISIKRELLPEQLFDGFPHQFVDFFKSVQNLQFTEIPNYSLYRSLFHEALIELGFVYDCHYDWSDTLTFSIFRCETENVLNDHCISSHIPTVKSNHPHRSSSVQNKRPSPQLHKPRPLAHLDSHQNKRSGLTTNRKIAIRRKPLV